MKRMKYKTVDGQQSCLWHRPETWNLVEPEEPASYNKYVIPAATG